MKIAALALAVCALVTGAYALAEPFSRYETVNTEWMRASGTGSYSDPRARALSDERSDLRSECQLLVLVILAGAGLGLLLALLALRKPGRALAIVAIVLSLGGAGPAFVMLAEGVF